MTIDLAALPQPSVIEELAVEDMIDAIKAELIAIFPAVAPVLQTESATTTKLIQAVAMRERLYRQRVNDAARAVLLAYAVGTDLDNVAANYGVSRLVIRPATDGSPAVMEGNDAFRRRIQLAMEAFSVAGPSGAYVFHALTAVPTLKDASAIQNAPGSVLVTLLNPAPAFVVEKLADSTPTFLRKVRDVSKGFAVSTTDIQAVRAAVSDDKVRPLTDMVTVKSAEVVSTKIVAELTLFEGPSTARILAQAMAAIEKLVEANVFLGRDLQLSAIFSRLHVEGVHSVDILEPGSSFVADPTQVVAVSELQLSIVGRDE